MSVCLNTFYKNNETTPTLYCTIHSHNNSFGLVFQCIHQKAITLKSLPGKLNNIDYAVGIEKNNLPASHPKINTATFCFIQLYLLSAIKVKDITPTCQRKTETLVW